MSGKRRKRKGTDAARDAFVRGFVAAGLLVVAEPSGRPASRAALGRAIKAGIAVASGTLVAGSLRRNDYAGTMVLMAGGATCMAVAGRLLDETQDERKERTDVEEEIA